MNPQHLFQIVYTLTEQDRQQVSQGGESATRNTFDWSLRLSAVTATVLGGLYDLVAAFAERLKRVQRPSNLSQASMRQKDKFAAPTMIE